MKRRSSSTTAALALAASAWLASASAQAQSELTDTQRAQRRALIQAHLDRESPAAQRWFWTWLLIPAASTVVQGAAAGVVAAPGLFSQSIVDNWLPGFVVGSITAAIGVIPQVALPFTPAFAAGQLRSYRARDARDGLGRAEWILRDCAETEETGRAWWVHLLGLGLAIGGSVATAGWMGWGSKPTVRENAWINAAVNLVTTVAMSELTIFTQPMGSARAWRSYQSTATIARAVPAPTVRASLTLTSIALVGTF